MTAKKTTSKVASVVWVAMNVTLLEDGNHRISDMRIETDIKLDVKQKVLLTKRITAYVKSDLTTAAESIGDTMFQTLEDQLPEEA